MRHTDGATHTFLKSQHNTSSWRTMHYDSPPPPPRWPLTSTMALRAVSAPHTLLLMVAGSMHIGMLSSSWSARASDSCSRDSKAWRPQHGVRPPGGGGSYTSEALWGSDYRKWSGCSSGALFPLKQFETACFLGAPKSPSEKPAFRPTSRGASRVYTTNVSGDVEINSEREEGKKRRNYMTVKN